jgi:CRISPR system Cascade subunit CasC
MEKSGRSLDFDAAAQVAHSISTHEVRTEYDYFTAVDDCAREDNAGAGHLGTVEFNSSTLYRYATVNVRELEKYLGDDTIQTLQGFVKAFLLSMPTGKQNTFANRTVPDFAYITLRADQPVNLVGAFEKPVYTRQDGYLDKSVNALREYAAKTYEAFVAKPERAYCVGVNVAELGGNISLSELMTALEKDINAYCGEE